MQGFVTNTNGPTAIGNAFANAIKLVLDGSVDPKARALPQACLWSHMSIKGVQTGAGVTQFEAFLTWDAQGDDILAGPTGLFNVVNGMTTATLRMSSVKVDAYVTATTEQAATGECYLWLRTNAGTMNVPDGGIKLHWIDAPCR